MNINPQYLSIYAEAQSTSKSASNKTLMDYMNDDNSSSSSSGLLSDTITLSPEAYAAIRENRPDMLASLGYIEQSDDSLLGSSAAASSSLDKVTLSQEAYNALKESNPELLQALGYSVDE